MRLPVLAYSFLVLVAGTMFLSEIVVVLDDHGALTTLTALILDAAGWLGLITLVIGGRLLGPPDYHRYMPWLFGCGLLWTVCCASVLPSWMTWFEAMSFVGLIVSVSVVTFGEVCPWYMLGQDDAEAAFQTQADVPAAPLSTRPEARSAAIEVRVPPLVSDLVVMVPVAPSAAPGRDVDPDGLPSAVPRAEPASGAAPAVVT